MKRYGWGLLVLSVLMLALAGMQAGRVPARGDPTGEMAEKLGAFTCPVIVFIPAVVLLILGSRKRDNSENRPRQTRDKKRPTRDTDDYEVLEE